MGVRENRETRVALKFLAVCEETEVTFAQLLEKKEHD